ncbi:predicted protein [Uncinocarpus reesii 1704]|uniref:DUF1917 domain-containing protein n=1 Tax=Uncinocarpus reesii (strain UAMH 1704) TaxID=336963 RepID=C4JZK1_UNCRE|nr:uncharacterized protein UREG_07602 [Uncinocarpus reesii 1704]EEP82737.1 predicted protein [Uncinocarpus reesii 1704]
MPPQPKLESFISDDSSFYGDEDEISEMEDRAAEFDPIRYWRTSHSTNLAVIAYSQRLAAENRPSTECLDGATIIETEVTQRHPHDGREYCRQATESVASFINRLPPSTTKAADIGPWIFIANREAPRPVVPNIDRLIENGGRLLEDFEEDLAEIQNEPKSKSSAGKAAVTRKINSKRRKLETDLLQTARDNGLATGKWMLFPSAESLDETWAAVADATAKGTLGIEAKVATDPENGASSKPRLICVYTRDFWDKEDVRRVLLKLVDMGVVSKAKGSSARPIYYKCDVYTHLNIMSGNKWGLKPTLCSSTEVLANKL